jgi:hypothetical protein
MIRHKHRRVKQASGCSSVSCPPPLALLLSRERDRARSLSLLPAALHRAAVSPVERERALQEASRCL